MYNNPHLDFDFLRELDLYNNKEIWAKITALNIDELPIEEIQGRVTGGSVSVDGTSSVRRTCSLTLVAQDVNINDWYWSLNTKFKVQIGLTNTIDEKYDNIIWFPMGFYLITSFNTILNANSYTINITGKDKMCLLNGDISGNLTALSYDFGKEYIYDENKNYIIKEILLKDIIKEAVHTYANEPYENIIINGFDEPALQLIEYRGDEPVYISIPQGEQEENFNKMRFYSQSSLDANLGENNSWYLQNGEKAQFNDIVLDQETFISFFNDVTEKRATICYPTQVNAQNKVNGFSIVKLEYGDTIGYKVTDLTYAGDLIANVNETITTSVLDKIKTQMGNYEYFYNLEGQFVFQRKPTYLYTSFSPEKIDSDGDVYIDTIADTTPYVYYFGDSNIVSSFQNTPSLNNIKNDYSVWGKRKGINGEEIPIHMRYAIDTKPEYYKNYKGEIFDARVEENLDWREIIYQMAIDYFKYNQQDDFLAKIAQNNKNYYPTGYTGYEQYYTDIEGFWRQLYNPDIKPLEQPEMDIENYYIWDEQNEIFSLADNNTILSVSTLPEKNYYIKINGTFYKIYYVVPPMNQYYKDKQYINGPKSGNVFYIKEGDEYSFYNIQSSEGNKLEYGKIYYQKISSGNENSYIKTCDLSMYDSENDKFLVESETKTVDFYFIGKKNYCYKKIEPEKETIFCACEYDSSKDSFTEKKWYYYHFDRNTQVYQKKENENLIYTKVSINDLFNKNIQYYNNNGEIELVTISNYSDKVRSGLYFLKTASNFELCNVRKFSPSTNKYYTNNQYNLNTHWNFEIKENPQNLNFWFDFINSEESDIGKYAVKKIGSRTKAENNDKVKAIYFKETPDIIILDNNESNEYKEQVKKDYEKDGYEILTFNNYMNMFSISARGISAKEELDNLLHQHTYGQETIQMTALPVYYLQPNTRIFVYDNKSGINGEYIVTKINYSLNYNGTMSVTAEKAVERLY